MIESILQEITNINLFIIFFMTVYIAIGWFISKFAKRTLSRLFWVTFGIYVIIVSAKNCENILLDIDTMLAVGFILPHIKFLWEWIQEIYDSLKMATINTFYFVVTIYFKIRNFFLWFYNSYKKIKSFFTNKKDNKQSYQKESYQEENRQNYNHYQDFNQNKDRAKQRKKQREQENDSFKQTNNDSSYEEEKVEETSDEFKQFFSSSYYEVLGVSQNDTFATIKKKYRVLVFQYHPDKNNNEQEKYTEIMQNINKAYEFFEKSHKK